MGRICASLVGWVAGQGRFTLIFPNVVKEMHSWRSAVEWLENLPGKGVSGPRRTCNKRDGKEKPGKLSLQYRVMEATSRIKTTN